jgi:hypothetical protein
VNDNGLNFLPECKDACFVGKKNIGCGHICKNVQINEAGEYILFPSQCWHHGYFNEESNKIFITAQLFARPTINEETERFSGSFTEGQREFISERLGSMVGKYSIIKDLSIDPLENWDSMYSATDFPPPKGFGRQPIDCKSNCQKPDEKLDERPLMKKLVDTFKEIFPYLSIDKVALLYERR